MPLPRRIGLEIEDLGLEQICSSSVDAGAALGRDLGREHVPTKLLQHHVLLQQSCLTFGTLAVGRSILLMATIIGTPAFRAWLIASTVCGITWSSAATTRTTMSVTCAAGAHRGESLVARRIEEGDPLVTRQLDVIRADVLGNATGLSGTMLALRI